MRGRRGAFGAFIDVRGSLATTVDPWTPTVFDAGVTLSAPEARCAWQAWRVRCLHRCPRKLGDDGGPMDADCLLRGRRDTFHLRLDLRGRRGAFGACPRKLGDDGGPMDADCLRRGRRDAFST